MQVLSFRSRRLHARVDVDRRVVRKQVWLAVHVRRDGGSLTRAFLVGPALAGSASAVLVGELELFFGQLDKVNDDDHVFAVLEALDVLTGRSGKERAS
jgi:hypothetical protein